MDHRSVRKAHTTSRSADNGSGQDSDRAHDAEKGRKTRRVSLFDTDHDEEEDDSQYESDEHDSERESDGDAPYVSRNTVSTITVVCVLLCPDLAYSVRDDYRNRMTTLSNPHRSNARSKPHQEKKIPRGVRDTAHTLHTPPRLEAPVHSRRDAPVRGNVVGTSWERARDGNEVGRVRNAECDAKAVASVRNADRDAQTVGSVVNAYTHGAQLAKGVTAAIDHSDGWKPILIDYIPHKPTDDPYAYPYASPHHRPSIAGPSYRRTHPPPHPSTAEPIHRRTHPPLHPSTALPIHRAYLDRKRIWQRC
jgi:hypothetical protein